MPYTETALKAIYLIRILFFAKTLCTLILTPIILYSYYLLLYNISIAQSLKHAKPKRSVQRRNSYNLRALLITIEIKMTTCSWSPVRWRSLWSARAAKFKSPLEFRISCKICMHNNYLEWYILCMIRSLILWLYFRLYS